MLFSVMDGCYTQPKLPQCLAIKEVQGGPSIAQSLSFVLLPPNYLLQTHITIHPHCHDLSMVTSISQGRKWQNCVCSPCPQSCFFWCILHKAARVKYLIRISNFTLLLKIKQCLFLGIRTSANAYHNVQEYLLRDFHFKDCTRCF